MANYEATRYNWDGEYLTSVQGINTGLIIPWGAASIPSGFLECNGASVSTSTYAALFAVIGYTYGGSGGNFNVPDLTDRTVVNKSNTKNLAQTMGANTVTPTGNISGSSAATTLTTNQIPSHSHSGMIMDGATGVMGAEQGTLVNTNVVATGSAGSDQSHSHNLSANFTGGANSVLQPFIVVIYIIKT
jgi:microcystin-dependent protein